MAKEKAVVAVRRALTNPFTIGIISCTISSPMVAISSPIKRKMWISSDCNNLVLKMPQSSSLKNYLSAFFSVYTSGN